MPPKKAVKKKTKETKNDLKSIIAEINKQHGENTIGFINKMPTLAIERLSSGSLWLDYALGGGWPLNRVAELFGNFSSGKTLISLKTIVEAQKRGLQCCFIDVEGTYDPRFAEKIGIDVNKLLISQSSVGEPTIDMICSLLDTGGVRVIVVDSVAALIPSSELTDPMQQQTIGLHARMMSKAMRKITTLNKNTLVIFINQQREMIGGFSNYATPMTTTGGRALGFYASVRIEVKRGEDIEANRYKIGQVIKFKIQKNKTSVPFRTGFIKYYYNKYAFDTLDEAISLGLILDIIKQSGPAYYLGNQSYFGRAKLEEVLTQDKSLFEQLKQEILKNDAFQGIEKEKAVKSGKN